MTCWKAAPAPTSSPSIAATEPDTVAPSTTQDNTVSLGGGITYADLYFQKSGSNLILKTAGSASSEGLTFANWYTATANHSVLNLQVAAKTLLFPVRKCREALIGINLALRQACKIRRNEHTQP